MLIYLMLLNCLSKSSRLDYKLILERRKTSSKYNYTTVSIIKNGYFVHKQ